MSIWKTLRQEKPIKFKRIIVLTKGGRLVEAFYDLDLNRFYTRIGLITPISYYKRWCYEEDLVKQILEEIKK